MFDFLKKKKQKEYVLGAPVKGTVIAIEEVNDPTFSGKILGDGVAVLPKEGQIFAPADGEITTAFATGHAVAMTADFGAEVLIHIGIDTVQLKGDGFDMKVQEGQKVKKGDLLVKVDLEKIGAAGYDLSTIMVVCNMDDYTEMRRMTGKKVLSGEDVVVLTSK